MTDLKVKPIKTESDSSCAKIISDLFSCRDYVHMKHLAERGSGSYARHMALGDLYDALAGHIDTIAELMQSYEGLLAISVAKTSAEGDTLKYLESVRTMLISKKESHAHMPDVANEMDSLIGSISKTIYKLKFLS